MIKLTSAFLALSLAWTAQANSLQKDYMKDELTAIANSYRVGYAPMEWKNKHLGWNLDTELNSAMGKIDSKAELTVKDYHKILKDFFRSTQDYHVGYSFISTERAVLPFTVKPVEGRYFISFILKSKLSDKVFPFNVGDEVVAFDGKPVDEVVQQLVAENGMGVPLTDLAIGALLLTARSATRAMDVPKGHVEVSVLPVGAKEAKTVQLLWDYTPESVQYPERNGVVQSLNPLAKSKDPGQIAKHVAQKIANTQMALFNWEELRADSDVESPEYNAFQIGGKVSYVPTLGTVIWQAKKENHYHAYIYKNDANKLIGYVRIAHYSAGSGEFNQFKEIIKHMEKVTDGLVIDEINNPGGSLFYIYALNSVLSKDLVYAPKEHIRINPSHIAEASVLLKTLENIQTEEQAQALLGKDWGGYPVTYQTIVHLKDYARFVIDQWNSGKTLTDPVHMWGVDKILPSNEVNYSKPILVLTNELDFSGGDFFPAILQDNKRAKIMGTRTAGAGGFVLGAFLPSAFGLESFSYTGSLARRINDQPIENLGVTPDVEYSLTVQDMQGGFSDYKNAINTEINSMIGN